MSNNKDTASENKSDQLSESMSITDDREDDLLDEVFDDDQSTSTTKEADAKEKSQSESWVQVVGSKNKQKSANAKDKFASFSEIQLCKVLGEIKIKSYRAARPGQTRVLKYLKNDLYELAFIICILANEVNQCTNEKSKWPENFRQALVSDKWFSDFKSYFNKKNPKYLCRSESLVRDFLSK